MAAALVETCRFMAPRSPWGRLGSVQDVGNHLRRMRGRFHRWPTLSASHRAGAQVLSVLDPELSGEPQALAHMRPRRLPDPKPIPERVRGPICIRKK